MHTPCSHFPILASPPARYTVAQGPMFHFPVLGIFHFILHPQMWCQVLLAMFLLLVIFLLLFSMGIGLVLAPQSDWLDNFMPAWLAWPLSFVLVTVQVRPSPDHGGSISPGPLTHPTFLWAGLGQKGMGAGDGGKG